MKIRACKTKIARGCAAALITISVDLVATNGFSQQTASAVEKEAQELLDAAVELMQAKQFPPACRKLEAVLQKLPQATGARLELARCYKGEGRLASAWQEYVQVENRARIAGQPARVAEASKNATELARIVGKLQLDVSAEVSAIAGVVITLDGKVQEPSSWRVPVPVDDMEHEIEVTAPGRQRWAKRVFVHDNLKGEVNAPPVVVKVEIPQLVRTTLRIDVARQTMELADLSLEVDGTLVDLGKWVDGALVEPGSHEVTVSAQGYESWQKRIDVKHGQAMVLAVPMLHKRLAVEHAHQIASTDVQPAKVTSFGKRTLGIIGVVTGGLSVGAGAILGGVAISQNNASNTNGHCTTNDDCDEVGYRLRSEAYTLANASTGTLVVGSVLAASGMILMAFSSPVRASTNTRATHNAKLWAGPTNVGLEFVW